MSPYVEWYDAEKTILIQDFVGEYGVADYQRIATETNELLNTVNHPVDIIMDFTQGKARKENFVASLGSIERKVHPNQRLLIAVKGSNLLKTLAHGMQRVVPKATANFIFVETFEHAKQSIDRFRAALAEGDTPIPGKQSRGKSKYPRVTIAAESDTPIPDKG